MEPLFFLLLVLCLLATAFSHPLGDSSTVPSSSDVLRGSEKSPLDLLARDIWFNVGTNLNLYERHSLSSIHNEVLKLLEWTPSERKDLKRIAESDEYLKVFYQAIIKQDIDALIISRVDKVEALLYGLQLAIRYRRAHAVWIFLAADWVERERFIAWAEFQKMTETQLEEYTEIVDKVIAEAKLQMTETQLAEYTKIVENPKLQKFFWLLIGTFGRGRQAAYRKLAMLKGDGSTFGLELTIRYGSNMDILVFLAFGELGSDTKVQDLVDEAIKKLTPTEREYFTKIQKSEPETKTFFQDLVEKRRGILRDHEKFTAIVKNDETAILAMQLSVWMNFTQLGGALLIFAKPEMKEKLFDAGAAVAAEGKLLNTWETIKRFHNDYKHKSSLNDYVGEAW